MEWEAQDEGVLAKILVGDGAQDVKVGTPVAVIVDDKADVRSFSAVLHFYVCSCHGAHGPSPTTHSPTAPSVHVLAGVCLRVCESALVRTTGSHIDCIASALD